MRRLAASTASALLDFEPSSPAAVPAAVNWVSRLEMSFCLFMHIAHAKVGEKREFHHFHMTRNSRNICGGSLCGCRVHQVRVMRSHPYVRQILMIQQYTNCLAQ